MRSFLIFTTLLPSLLPAKEVFLEPAPGTDLTELISKTEFTKLDLALGNEIHFISKPIELKGLSNLTFRAKPGTRPVISGGRIINGWKQVKDNLWQTTVPEVESGHWSFRELFLDGQPRQRARHPNQGTFRITKAGPDDRSSFFFKDGDLKDWPDPEQIEFAFYHDWSLSRVNLTSIDLEKKQAFLRDPVGQTTAAHYAMSHFEKTPRFHLENHPAFLDSPGEWHLDPKSGVLSYLAMDGENPNDMTIIAPKVEALVSMTNCKNIEFDNISFQHCRYQLPPGGSAGVQAAFHQRRPAHGKYENIRDAKPAAFHITNSSGITFNKCTFANLGASGLWIANGCSNVKIEHSVFKNIGANGIMIGDTNATKETVTKKVHLYSNLVRSIGTLDYGAVGIWIGIAAETRLTGNELRNLPYTGISLGWRWSPVPTPSRGHLIVANHIHHIMQKLSDGGGIYTLGLHPDTYLRSNTIHHVPVNAGRAESNGMFLDQGSTSITIEDNTIYAIARSPLRFHQAGKNLVRNNTLYRKNEQTPHLRFNNTPEENITDQNNKTPVGKGPE